MSILRRACTAGVAALLLSLAGPAEARDRADDRALRRELRARGLDPEAVIIPHAIDERMIAWVEDAVSRRLPADARVEALLMQLIGHSELDLEYHRDYTGTAIEVFETGKANCLAFTHLFIGLSRYLELPVYYLKVDDLQAYQRSGDLVVVSGHITAGYGPRNQPKVLEFAIYPVAEYHRVEPLSDISALALFYSNRGAELLLDGDVAGALGWLQTAVRIDPTVPQAWVNLGVAFRRDGRFRAAEDAYRHALEIDPEYSSAYQNLSALLQKIEGRGEEGRQLLTLTDQKANRNPFNYLALGDLSLAQSRVEDAGRYFRRAHKLAPGEAETMAAMGVWSLEIGRARAAKKWLRKARKVDPDNARVARLSRAIEGGGDPA